MHRWYMIAARKVELHSFCSSQVQTLESDHQPVQRNKLGVRRYPTVKHDGQKRVDLYHLQQCAHRQSDGLIQTIVRKCLLHT